MSDVPPGSDRSGKKMMSFLLDEELYNNLKSYSAASGQSMSSVIQTALSLHLFPNASTRDVGVSELAKMKNLDLPDPSLDDVELIKWIAYHDRHELYNAVRVLVVEGGSFRDFAFRILSIAKQYAPLKYYFTIEATRRYVPEVYDDIMRWENGSK
jgi:hypothetical protein